MDKFVFYQELMNEICQRTNFDWLEMSDVDRLVTKKIFTELRNKYQELIDGIDVELDKINLWEEYCGAEDNEDVDRLVGMVLN